MNEEQLASLLESQIDALLFGKPVPAELPSAITELIPVANSIAAAAPMPRADFGAALKASLLDSGLNGSGPTSGGSNGFTGSGGSTGLTSGGKFWMLSLVGLIVTSIIALSGVFSTDANIPATAIPSASENEAIIPPTSDTLLSTPAQQEVVQPPTDTPEPTATRTATATPTDTPTATSTPTATPTLSPTLTPTATPVESSPADPASTGEPDGDSSNGNPNDGDGDNGHGNDEDGYDESNPGNSDGTNKGGNIDPGNDNGGDNGGGGGGGKGKEK